MMLTESISIDEWLKQREPELIDHADNCLCDECVDNHEIAEEYDEATGFEY